MITGASVKQLVARMMHAGIFDGGKDQARPVVWQEGYGAPMIFTFVQPDQAATELGRVDHTYPDCKSLVRDIADAHVAFGVPTQAWMAEAFPNGGRMIGGAHG